MKHGDVMLGAAGSVATFVASHFNEFLGSCVGLVSLAVMLLRLRREWKHRNEPPPKHEEE